MTDDYGAEVYHNPVMTKTFGPSYCAPAPDPRLENGFGHAPERVVETPAQDRHPAGAGDGQGGRFR